MPNSLWGQGIFLILRLEDVIEGCQTNQKQATSLGVAAEFIGCQIRKG